MRPPYLKAITIAAPALILVISVAYAEPGAKERRRELRQIENEFTGRGAAMVDPSALAGLEEYLAAGLTRNPTLKAAFYEWKAALQNVSRQFSLPDPQFSYTDYLEEVETRVGPQERAYSIRQMFPFPDKLWIRKSKAFRSSEAAYHNFVKARLDLISSIADAYFEFAYLSKAVLITSENLKLLQSFESVAQSKYSSGLTKNQDLLKVQVELGKLENELKSLEDLRSPVTSRLIALLNLPHTTQLPWPEDQLEMLPSDDDYADMNGLIDELRKNNPQLMALAASVAGSEDELKLAQREYVPDFTVGVTQIDTGPAVNPSMADSGKDPLTVMVAVNVPIWFHRINAEIRQARASLEAAELKREGAEDELLSRLAMVHYKLRDARRQAQLYNDALIPKAVQTLNATKSAYESGGMDFLSLIDAQRMLLSFQMTYYRHNANFYQRLYQIQALLGEVTSLDQSQGDGK